MDLSTVKYSKFDMRERPRVSNTQRLIRESKKKVQAEIEEQEKLKKYLKYKSASSRDEEEFFGSVHMEFKQAIKYFKLERTKSTTDFSCIVGPVQITDISIISSMTVTRLLLSNCRLGNEGVRAVARGLVNNFTVRELDLSGNELDVNAIISIGEMLNGNENLELLSLASNNLTDADVQPLMHCLHKCNLKGLCLGNNILADGFAKALGSVLVVNSKLEVLHLASNQLAVQGLLAMETGIRKSKFLKCLDISWNYLYDAGAKVVANIIKENKSLGSVSICGNFIEVEGASYIGESLKKNSNLKSLRMGHNLYKNEGAYLLIKPLLNSIESSLEILDINGTIVDKRLVSLCQNELQEKFPLLNVLHFTESDQLTEIVSEC